MKNIKKLLLAAVSVLALSSCGSSSTTSQSTSYPPSQDNIQLSVVGGWSSGDIKIEYSHIAEGVEMYLSGELTTHKMSDIQWHSSKDTISFKKLRGEEGDKIDDYRFGAYPTEPGYYQVYATINELKTGTVNITVNEPKYFQMEVVIPDHTQIEIFFDKSHYPGHKDEHEDRYVSRIGDTFMFEKTEPGGGAIIPRNYYKKSGDKYIVYNYNNETKKWVLDTSKTLNEYELNKALLDKLCPDIRTKDHAYESIEETQWFMDGKNVDVTHVRYKFDYSNIVDYYYYSGEDIKMSIRTTEGSAQDGDRCEYSNRHHIDYYTTETPEEQVD